MLTSKISQIWERILLVIIICIMSFPAYAKYSGGTGEPNNPYQIATAEDLIALGNEPNDYDKHFILIDDINLAGNVFDKAVIAPTYTVGEWYPDWFGVLVGTPFTGIFDGNGHTISHLKIEGLEYLGLFGYVESESEIRNVGVMDVNIFGPSHCVGGLVGCNCWGTVTQCNSTGVVDGNNFVGGLVGYNSGGIIIQCYSTSAVSGSSVVGGLVGGTNGGSLTQCYSKGAVSGSSEVGGLVGYNTSYVTRCYSTGAVSGSSEVGGLVGINYI